MSEVGISSLRTGAVLSIEQMKKYWAPRPCYYWCIGWTASDDVIQYTDWFHGLELGAQQSLFSLNARHHSKRTWTAINFKTGPLENQLESVRRPEPRLNSSECTLIKCIQIYIYVYDRNSNRPLCGTRTVIFEHSSIVESWYCSTLKHENHFASLFRPLRTTARRTDWFSNGPVFIVWVKYGYRIANNKSNSNTIHDLNPIPVFNLN
jgi:hypothetical protein